jgi:hypothetical protein
MTQKTPSTLSENIARVLPHDLDLNLSEPVPTHVQLKYTSQSEIVEVKYQANQEVAS